MPKPTPQYILDFVEAVYTETAELALAMFSEEACIKDATELIKRLRERVRELEAGLLHLRVSVVDALKCVELVEEIVDDPCL